MSGNANLLRSKGSSLIVFASRRLAWPLLLVALLAFPLALAACGGDDSNDERAAQYKQEVEREARERVRANREAKEALVSFYEVLERAPSTGSDVAAEKLCDLMSPDAQTDSISYAQRVIDSKRQWDCESSIAQTVLSAGGAGAGKVKIVDVDTRGGTVATLTVDLGTTNREVRMVKDAEGWKLDKNENPDNTAPQAARESAVESSSTLLP